MAEVADQVRDLGPWPTVKKRWRAWLRAIHRDIGYLAIGFTVIYAVSGIAQNHIEDWGDVSYTTYEKTIAIPPIADDVADDVAIARVAAAAGLGNPSSSFRAGDEIRLEYGNGAKVTAIGAEVTIQGRERRAFIGAANWLHTARNKAAWRYVADAYAVLLLYLAISGIFMIKGRLGLRGRGAVLISIGVAIPVLAVTFGRTASPELAEPATATAPPLPSGIRLLPVEDGEPEPTPDPEPVPTTQRCDPFSSMRGCK
jgi:uncharacterized protein